LILKTDNLKASYINKHELNAQKIKHYMTNVFTLTQ